MRSSFIEQARRRQFVQCALDSLHETGFAGTSLAAVAERAQISKSVVVYHFGSKQALLEAVVESVYASQVPDVVAALDAASGPRARLLAYVRIAVLFAAGNAHALTAVAEIFRNLRRPDGTLRYTAADNEQLITFVENLLRDGQATGDFGDFDPRTVALVIRSALDALPERFTLDPALTGPDVAAKLCDAVDRMTR
ncbi:putative transcriptional regulator, TetR family protein [Paractinoplanes abujensis]|uniref:AcrR family transcriptional regulator n=1 Tax=Paractinoplanes abujensis TaxID=882441 RepID=A0A7W7CNZ3_9ACTN|nr:TetR/AcrR family transcriptional regulator [Actinoplanes abujensis]MBB4692055.1 AcrR family transcriptional regulator [Actinoplanes abujensis]GID16528.1 putative transcriptional regulator, TetR family protein [Actinoplanes abujensis]